MRPAPRPRGWVAAQPGQRDSRSRQSLPFAFAFALALALALGCRRQPEPQATTLPAVDVGSFIHPGDRPLPLTALKNPYAGKADVANAGAQLFVQMNCDGCHGDGASGAIGPNLGDGRFKYGAGDAAIFQSIYEGRPNGMPAWGTVLAPDLVWRLVTYIQSLKPDPTLATEDWRGQGNAAAMGH